MHPQYKNELTTNRIYTKGILNTLSTLRYLSSLYLQSNAQLNLLPK